MKKRLFATSALVLSLSTPAHADPTVGFGFSLAFGSGQTEAGVGLRIFSDDREDEFAATIGLDYMFQSQRFRPTIGAAYLGDNVYLGLDLGYDFTAGSADFGVSAGGLDTSDDAPAPGPAGGNGGNGGGGGTNGGPETDGGGTNGLGETPLMNAGNASDMRLKRDIVLLGQLDNGVSVYTFRYRDDLEATRHLDCQTTYVGVMAQDLLESHPDAVVTMANGYFAVLYDRIGFQMQTYDDWRGGKSSAALPDCDRAREACAA